MGDACVIDVINDDGGLYQAALHFDANVSVAQRGIINIFLYPQVTPLSGGVIKVIEDGKHEAINTENVGPDDKLSRSGRLAMNGFKAALIVPIRQRERTIGTITLFSLSVGLGRSYTKHDLVILEQIALRIAAALEIKFLWEQITEAAA
jgi:GAF domain-containing protein